MRSRLSALRTLLPRRPRALLTPFAVAALAILVAACGASPKNASSTSTGPNQAQAIKFAQCMRANGVPNFPDPQSGGGFQINVQQNGSTSAVSANGNTLNVSAPAFQAAQKKCQKYMPKGKPASASQLAKIRQQALKMAQCMRSHGVPNFPDPQVTAGPNGRGVAMKIGASANGNGKSKIDPQSPAFKNAQKVCQPLMRDALKPNP